MQVSLNASFGSLGILAPIKAETTQTGFHYSNLWLNTIPENNNACL